ncbi:MAG: DUF3267 domain-containing protein [Chloroflexi bacterium]|nr:DUF3267 domain-containing protein [Chloroflexota bacterium]
MSPVAVFFAVAAIYTVAAAVTLWHVIRDWRALFDARWTVRDRTLAERSGFLLLTPPLVWLHEWGHALAMRHFGAADPQIHFFLYWGYVTAQHPFTRDEAFWTALAGPLTSWVLGWALLVVALLAPLPPAAALAVAIAALTDLALVLILYPAWSLVGGWGDFVDIYRGGPPGATPLVGAAHGLSLLAFGWLLNRPWLRGFLLYPRPFPWRTRWGVHTTPGNAQPSAES